MGDPTRNIIVEVVIDCLRYDATKQILESIPRHWKSTIFENYYSAGPTTWVSYATMFTSTPPYTTGLGHIRDRVSFVEDLKRTGYRTIGVPGDQSFISSARGFSKGFDEYLELTASDGRRTLATMLRECFNIASKKNGLEPRVVKLFRQILFSLYFCLHRMVNPDYSRISSSFDVVQSAIQVANRAVTQSESKIFLFLHILDLHDPYTYPKSVASDGVLGYYFSALAYKALHYGMKVPGKMRVAGKAKDYYFKSTSVVKLSLEMLCRYLDSIAELYGYSPYLLITADHGEEFLEHGGLGHMGLNLAGVEIPHLYNEVVHIPLIIASPSLASSTIRKDLASHYDLAPTILQIASAGNDSSDRYLGEPLLGDVPITRTRYVVSQAPAIVKSVDPMVAIGRTYSMVKDQFKYIVHPTLGEELYYLTDDPGELHNLLREMPEISDQFRKALKDQIEFETQLEIKSTVRTEASQYLSGEDDKKVSERLRVLGYM